MSTNEKDQEVLELLKEGHSYSEIAEQVHCSYSRVSKVARLNHMSRNSIKHGSKTPRDSVVYSEPEKTYLRALESKKFIDLDEIPYHSLYYMNEWFKRKYKNSSLWRAHRAHYYNVLEFLIRIGEMRNDFGG